MQRRYKIEIPECKIGHLFFKNRRVRADKLEFFSNNCSSTVVYLLLYQ